VEADTAGAAELVAKWNNKEEAAIASSLAAEIYGLDVLKTNVEDAVHNTTRFYVMAPKPIAPDPAAPDLMTTFGVSGVDHVYTIRKAFWQPYIQLLVHALWLSGQDGGP